MLNLILLMLAFVLALISSKWNPPGTNLLALAIALYFLSLLLGLHPLVR